MLEVYIAIHITSSILVFVLFLVAAMEFRLGFARFVTALMLVFIYPVGGLLFLIHVTSETELTRTAKDVIKRKKIDLYSIWRDGYKIEIKNKKGEVITLTDNQKSAIVSVLGL